MTRGGGVYGEERKCRKYSRKRERCFPFLKDLIEYWILWVWGCTLKEEILSFPCVVYNRNWDGRHKLFIHVDICFLSLPVQKKREKGEKQQFWRNAKVVFVTSVSQSQCHFFSRYYSCHPCFLLYCSISECCLVYGLDMCERRRCESQ